MIGLPPRRPEAADHVCLRGADPRHCDDIQRGVGSVKFSANPAFLQADRPLHNVGLRHRAALWSERLAQKIA